MLIFDIETNGLHQHLKQLHCVVLWDSESSCLHPYRPDELYSGLRQLKERKVIAGHNIIGFDLPALFKLYGEWDHVPNVVDTLVLSRFLWPERPWGHSLKGWGKHLGIEKIDFEYTEENFAEFSEEMLAYCIQDVLLNAEVFKALEAEYGHSLSEGYNIYN